MHKHQIPFLPHAKLFAQVVGMHFPDGPISTELTSANTTTTQPTTQLTNILQRAHAQSKTYPTTNPNDSTACFPSPFDGQTAKSRAD